MTTVVTRGAASAQALGYASSSAAVTYIEDVFSTYLDLADGANTIVNGINLSTYGGLVWHKTRSAAYGHDLRDSARGFRYGLESNSTGAQFDSGASYFTANTNGFFDAYDSGGNTDVWWTFREQPKFFDVVTYTGDGTSARAINHNLGSAPGMIVVKCTNDASNWPVYHRSLGATKFVLLNKTDEAFSSSSYWANTEPTSTQFSVGFTNNQNSSGQTYVAYLFAHNAGGFGLTGTDNVISCGSFTTDASGVATVNLGYEPQWILMKDIAAANWQVFDVMRGQPVTGGSAKFLRPNTSDAESNQTTPSPNATGFSTAGSGPWGDTVTRIYIAIRRGPMKVPTDVTTVFNAVARTGSSSNSTYSIGAINGGDLFITKARSTTYPWQFLDALRGYDKPLDPSTSGTETTDSPTNFVRSTSVDYTVTGSTIVNNSGQTHVDYLLRRAPGFFDEVCYTGTGSATTVTHNLGVAPEFIQVKCRSNANGWMGYSAATGNTKYINFADVDSAQVSSTSWNNTSPTSSVFTVGTDNSVNGSARTYVAYLFATVAGVSKVGSYTGNGTTQTIDCGFGAGGVRFVLIKRTDSTGGWYVYDTARGMTVLTDPYLFLNTTAAEVATLGSVTTVSTGFALNSAILAAINVNAGTYIFLAIA